MDISRMEDVGKRMPTRENLPKLLTSNGKRLLPES